MHLADFAKHCILQVTKDNMQQQLADMTAQLHAVETEHDQLTGRNSVLEKVLHVRQLQLEILQDQQQVGTFKLQPWINYGCTSQSNLSQSE